MKEIKEIQKQIDDTRKRHIEIKKELVDLKTQLDAKRRAQGSAIVGKTETESLESEIVSLQTKISGAEEAQEQLLSTLRDLQEAKSDELHAIARAQAEKEKGEILLIEADIYASIAQAVNRLPDLYRKRLDYLEQLQASGKTSNIVRDEGRSIAYLFETLRRELPNLLDIFPYTIVADGTLPTPKAIRGMLKRE